MAEFGLPTPSPTREEYYAAERRLPPPGTSQKEQALALHRAGTLGNTVVSSEWMEVGICKPVDGEQFFPESGVNQEDAKKVCRGCPVQEPCLEYALGNKSLKGIWGGTGERERRRIRKQRVAEAAR